ncbi:MAG: ABC transporter ATP-binding protein [Thermoanaerobaculia bacterium]|nr:ABC transporter ATP-binding protein [Thermoanaerobaculia bacterium]
MSDTPPSTEPVSETSDAATTADGYIVDLDHVSLCYRLAKQRIPSIKDYAIHWMRGALVYEQLWALKDVTLKIRRGETVAIVGRNGAGKSTMLKVISGVLKPTKGTASRQGRISPILELGTGFDFELSGIENIYLNGLLLGRSRKEIDEKVEDIIEFSGLNDFVRSPIRNYSSGMVARLGFSIATAWVPEVLVLDEALSVGDNRFVPRCEERLARYREAGSTLLMVSHNHASLAEFCTRAIWLEQGQLLADGPIHEVLAKYLDFAAHGDDDIPAQLTEQVTAP